MKHRLCLAAITAIMTCQAVAEDHVINFDNLSVGTVVTNQYPWATFSSNTGNENYVVNSPVGTGDKVLASGSSGTPTYLQDTYLDFTTPLVHLSVIAYMPQPSTGIICSFNFYQNGAFTNTESFTRNGGQAFQLNFNGYPNLTRLEIVNVQQAVTWDNFVLTVPESSTLFALGICVLSLVCLRRNKTNA